YSASGDAWTSFPFAHARSRAYRWGEDGIAGICDVHGFLNLGVALWNGRDPFLKERYFGLTNDEGNHGEDVKEHWWVTDGTPTHSWMQVVYRYPQCEFPYAELRERARVAGRNEREPELSDTGALDGNRFFDVAVSYAKASPTDVCVEITATNHGPDPRRCAAPAAVVPQHVVVGRDARKPSLVARTNDGWRRVTAEHGALGRYTLHVEGTPTLLVTDNETNEVELFGTERNPGEYTATASTGTWSGATRGLRVVGPDDTSEPGTKVAAWYSFDPVEPGESVTVRLRLVEGTGTSTRSARASRTPCSSAAGRPTSSTPPT
ncbi:glucosidase, partial [Saccharothrix sp. MB29]|nr:glucosidase [Saccharothrix sp. MB29]